MIYIVNINAQKFSLNGIPYFKNFSPVVFDGSDSLKIVNTYDSRFELVPYTNFNEFEVDSVSYGSVAELQEALLPVLFTRATLGAGGGVESVNGSSVDNSDPLNPYINPFTFQEITDASPVTTQSIEVGGLKITNKVDFDLSLLTALRNVVFPNKSGTFAFLDDITTLLQGLAWKQPVELNLNSGVSLSGSIPYITSLTQQGHTLVDNSRVIITGGISQIYNGFYRVNATPVSGQYRLYRTDDANTSAELTNAVCDVSYGTFSNKSFRQKTPNPVIGTSNIVFEDFGSSVALATDLTAGISKLYNAVGTETDGGITPYAVNIALDLKADKSSLQFVHQLSDPSSTSTTKTNTDIIFAVEPNSVYKIIGFIYGGCSSSGGMRIGWTLPSGCSGNHAIISFNSNTPANANTIGIASDLTGFAFGSNIQQTRYEGFLTTGSNGGTITLGFGSTSAGQSSTFRTFSNFIMIKKP